MKPRERAPRGRRVLRSARSRLPRARARIPGLAFFVLGSVGAGLVAVLACDGSGSEAQVATASSSTKEPRYDGKVLYERFCMSCHGETGTGDGVQSKLLEIQPRNFTTGTFKFTSHVEGMPSDDDLFRTLSLGVNGTEMSPYDELPPAAIRAIVAYVKELTVGKVEVSDEDMLAELDGVRGSTHEDGKLFAMVNWFELHGVGTKIEVPEPPPPSQELVDLGKSLFEGKAACIKCHGVSGKGDGPSAKELEDDWGFKITPRDLTSDQFKGGHDPKDVYLRIMAGIPGTPMPSSITVLEAPRETWALVYYVLKLAHRVYIPK